MIPRRYIEEWKLHAPWPDNAQVEQDLVIERALVELFTDDMLHEHLAFRGGTALHKLYLSPQVRYSEDIDLVQVKEGAIGPILKRIRDRMKFLGLKRTVMPRAHNNTIIYRFDSEIAPVINMRLKIEINCKEHFSVFGYENFPFVVDNGWFKGKCTLHTYLPEELLGTKLRALYQRRKGRDLFDLYWALENIALDTGKIIECYKAYMDFSVAQPPTQKMFILNIDEKMKDPEFTKDISFILRPGVEYDNERAYELVKSKLLERI